MFKKAFQVLQQIGMVLMTPVAVLPAAGILLRFGEKDMLGLPLVQSAGGVIFESLPEIFAVAVAIGLTDGEGIAGLAAVFGYLIFTKAFDNMGILLGSHPPFVGATHLFDMGVLGGVIIGLLAAILYKKFYNIKLPPVLGFFAGKRFVPIVTAISSLGLGVVFAFIWLPVQHGIDVASAWVTHSVAGPFFFGAIQCLLVPFGLHHIFQTPFYFTLGSYVDPESGRVVTGEIARFFAGDKTAGRFMAGSFPYMMFGLPAAALAMIHEARPERRKSVSGMLISAGLTSMLTGIAEPVEFAFLFVAPVLFLIHVFLAGISFAVMDILHVKHGYSFSGGAIDYFLNYGLSTNGWMIIPFGLLLGVLYYFSFRFVIRKWDLKTLGRESGEARKAQVQCANQSSLAVNVLKALGGKDNLTALDACLTRLRATVENPGLVDKVALKQLGAVGFFEIGHNFQAIFGTQSETLKRQINEIMRTGESGNTSSDPGTAKPYDPQEKKKEQVVYAPLSGNILELSEVPDPVFAEKMMGDGFAIQPTDGLVLSPVKGKVLIAFPTKHAVGLLSEDNMEILVHVGTDTVKLKGEGFELFVQEGDLVEVGTPLLKVDLAYINAHAQSSITPVVFTNLKGQSLEVNKTTVVAGQTIACMVRSDQ